jgi:hypothetical protein
VWGRVNASEDQYDPSQVPKLVQRLQRELRLPALNWVNGVQSATESLVKGIIADRECGVEILDCILHMGGKRNLESAGVLALYFDEAGSAWQVVGPDGIPALERRVAEEVAEAARFVMSDDSRASQHLRTAWHDAYGRSPTPSHAYREAVRAVEAVARPIIAPKNTKATLGTMIAHLRDGADKWATVFADSQVGGVEVVLRNMQLLWLSQFDRHGTDDESVPLTVGIEEARAAVHLAVLLTHWFRTGVIVAKN